MLSFLNGGSLFALIAVTIPLIIHLINRHKQRRIKFSTLHFLKSIEEKRIRRIKLYQLLLILLRSLVILFLVLSFARPVMIQKTDVRRYTAGSTAVIILDNGLNMQAYDKEGSRFDRARNKLFEIAAQFGATDKLLIIPARDPERPLSDSVAIAALPCSYTAVDWQVPATVAADYFKANPNYNQDLFIISDFQFNDRFFTSAFAGLPAIRIHLIMIGTSPSYNVSIDTLIIRNKIFETGKPVNLEVGIHNSSRSSTDNTDLQLFINDRRMAYQKIDLQPLEQKMIPLTFPLKTGQKVEGFVELSDDDLLGDNRYYFSLNLPGQLQVLFVDMPVSGYLAAALESIEGNTNIRITSEGYNSWAGKKFNDYQVIFLSNFPPLPTVLLDRLKSFLTQGGNLILMPGDRTDLQTINRICHDLDLPLTVESIREITQTGEFFTLRPEDWNQPVFADIFRNSAADLSNPNFYKYYKLTKRPELQTLLTFNTGDPFIVTLSDRPYTVFFIASFIDDRWTDFQFKGIFLPLLVRLLLLGGTNPDQLNQSYTIGHLQNIRIHLPENPKEIFIGTDDGPKNKLVSQLDYAGISIDLRSISSPGNYKLYSDSKELLTLSINPSTRSLFPPYIDLNGLVDQSGQVTLIRENQNLAERIGQTRSGIELTQILVFLVTLTLLLEIALIKSIEGRKPNS